MGLDRDSVNRLKTEYVGAFHERIMWDRRMHPVKIVDATGMLWAASTCRTGREYIARFDELLLYHFRNGGKTAVLCFDDPIFEQPAKFQASEERSKSKAAALTKIKKNKGIEPPDTSSISRTECAITEGDLVWDPELIMLVPELRTHLMFFIYKQYTERRSDGNWFPLDDDQELILHGLPDTLQQWRHDTTEQKRHFVHVVRITRTYDLDLETALEYGDPSATSWKLSVEIAQNFNNSIGEAELACVFYLNAWPNVPVIVQSVDSDMIAILLLHAPDRIDSNAKLTVSDTNITPWMNQVWLVQPKIRSSEGVSTVVDVNGLYDAIRNDNRLITLTNPEAVIVALLSLKKCDYIRGYAKGIGSNVLWDTLYTELEENIEVTTWKDFVSVPYGPTKGTAFPGNPSAPRYPYVNEDAFIDFSHKIYIKKYEKAKNVVALAEKESSRVTIQHISQILASSTRKDALSWCVPANSMLQSFARRLQWLLTYWINAYRVGTPIPDAFMIDDLSSKSVWGYTYSDSDKKIKVIASCVCDSPVLKKYIDTLRKKTYIDDMCSASDKISSTEKHKLKRVPENPECGYLLSTTGIADIPLIHIEDTDQFYPNKRVRRLNTNTLATFSASNPTF